MRRIAATVAVVATAGWALLTAVGCSRHAPAERLVDARDASPTASRSPARDANDPRDAGDEANDARAAGEGATDAGDAAARAQLAGYPSAMKLEGEGEKLGVVSVPLGAGEPRPIMIALHGGSETPERACEAWRGVTEGYPFIVCPRGFGGVEGRLGWRTTSDTAARIARAVAATRAIFGSWVKETPAVVLAGFSMGGTQVAQLASAEPQRYRRLALGDSAHEPQPAMRFARAWAAGGGERAVFLCSTSGCEPPYRNAARNVAHQKVAARLNIAPTQVHGLSERVVQSMRRDWPWLVDGAAGWEAYRPPVDPELPGKTEIFDAE